jgi:alpha/beta superfamily hydrolase
MIIRPSGIALENGQNQSRSVDINIGKEMTENEIRMEIKTEDKETLEARLTENPKGIYAVICHPHPLFGGTMDNNVVLAARDALLKIGFGTLRFNFRGVGMSTGHFLEGDGEALDVIAACRYLEDDCGSKEIHVAAYSFGAFAFLKAVKKGLHAAGAALISPPVTFMGFSDLNLPASPCLIVVGDSDQYCALADLETWLASQKSSSPRITKAVLPVTDHFYWGSEQALQKELIDFWSKSTT